LLLPFQETLDFQLITLLLLEAAVVAIMSLQVAVQVVCAQQLPQLVAVEV
jgi:hypothetical protein